MRTLNKVMAARYQQENHVTRYPVILYRSVELSPESLDIERFHFRRAILDLEQVAPLVDGGGSSERLQ